MKTQSHTKDDHSGSQLAQFCRAVGISLAGYYTLPEHQKPLTIKLGKRRVPVETPEEYKRRILALQQAESSAA
jgi:hypothetical protein